MDGVLEIEMRRHARPGRRRSGPCRDRRRSGSSVRAAPVVGDHAVAVLEEEQHLGVPVVARKRPAVTEDDRLARAPVLVEDLRAVRRGDRAHAATPSVVQCGNVRAASLIHFPQTADGQRAGPGRLLARGRRVFVLGLGGRRRSSVGRRGSRRSARRRGSRQRRREVEDAVVVARAGCRRTCSSASRSITSGLRGVADEVGAELADADAAEGHVEAHDLALLAVLVLDRVQGDVRVARACSSSANSMSLSFVAARSPAPAPRPAARSRPSRSCTYFWTMT